MMDAFADALVFACVLWLGFILWLGLSLIIIKLISKLDP
jgi:hypothetical protein